MLETNVVENKYILCWITFLFLFRMSYRLCDYVEKWRSARQATDDNKRVIRRRNLACWATEATDTHSECVILIVSPRQQWFGERDCLVYHHPLENLDAPGLAIGLVVGTSRRLLPAVRNRHVLWNMWEIFNSWATVLWVFNFLGIRLCVVGLVVCDVSIDRDALIFRGSSPRTSHRNP